MCMVEAMPYPTREWIQRMLSTARLLLNDEPLEAARLAAVVLAALASQRDSGMLVVAKEMLEGRIEPRHLEALTRHYPRLTRVILEAFIDPESAAKLVKAVAETIEPRRQNPR